jgi:hypothetical protein
MRRKGKGSLPAHVLDSATRGGLSRSRTRQSNSIEETLPGFGSPKSHEMDRAMHSVLTSRPRMSNKAYWSSYYEIQDEMKRRRSNKPRFSR